MKVHKVVLCIIDHDEIEGDEIKDVIENTHYPNRCIDPTVVSIESREIGEWYDDHLLNCLDTLRTEFQRMFTPAPSDPTGETK